MRAEAIEKLLSTLGCVRIRHTHKGIRSSCPFASWNHSKGEDKHPSFLVYAKNDDMSHAGCLSAGCRFKGDLNDLLYKLQKLSGRDLSAQLLYVSENDSVSVRKRMEKIESVTGWYSSPPPSETPSTPTAAWTGGKDYSDPAVMAELHPPLPDSHIEHSEKMIKILAETDEAWEYLTGPKRRFTTESIRKWKLGWHPGPRRIAVPQYDHIGRLVNLGGRYLRFWEDIFPTVVPAAAREDRVPKWMHSLGFEREYYLFGEDWFELSNDGTGTVFIVEGAFDAIYLDQCGIKNVAAINGSHVNRPQVEKILKWFDSVVLVMDGDKAGKEARDRLELTFSQRVHVATYLIPDGRDPNEMTPDEIEDLKARFVR
jgi:5S rRNA maturation endonuclease (ribonuclease M5)